MIRRTVWQIHCFCHISWNLIFRHVLSGLQILRMQWESKEKESMSDEQYALKAVEYVKALNRKLNIPTIKEIKGITEERFEAIAERSANNVLSNDNARKITKEDYLELLKKLTMNNEDMRL